MGFAEALGIPLRSDRGRKGRIARLGLLGRYVEKMLKGYLAAGATSTESNRINTNFLQKHGFL
jgi:hypothetical protein